MREENKITVKNKLKIKTKQGVKRNLTLKKTKVVVLAIGGPVILIFLCFFVKILL